MSVAPRLEINYCTQCRWLLRAGWLAQELLTTFDQELGEVALVPGTGGVFRLHLDGELLWDRSEQRGFPELPTLKRLVRDRIAPGRSLGHTDRATDGPTDPAADQAAGQAAAGAAGGQSAPVAPAPAP